ncbi:MAG: hypothetical protein A2289_09690 [Deltaproteobacteria bacterium RIFOXYA12_FULL_58_15]|nr:MAG: hypothetical protein A2289_09690 [Deltaproteobacteria bacterium RIFOXYA12_FULL_58_15]OGR13696.1 MAG: hypothetical protein A2341_21265 [Deltaproteobacteria bacterium RIFOXYB12_FULL_58_9]
MESLVAPLTNLAMAAGGENPLLGPFIGLGIKVLALMATIAFAREAYRLATGQPTHFVDVAVRWIVAAVLVMSIPHLATWMETTLKAAGNSLFAIGNAGLLEASYKKATNDFKCNDLDWMDIITMMAMPSGWLMLMAQLVSLVAQIGKLVIIDILWPIVLNVTIIAGTLTVPVGFLEELGGLKTYMRNVLSVACWPLMFAILTVGIAGSFQKTLGGVKRGDIKPNCTQLDTSGSSDLATELMRGAGRKLGLSEDRVARMEAGGSGDLQSNVSTDTETSLTGMMHFIAICVAHIFLMFSIPKVSKSLFGASGVGETISAAITGGGVATTQAAKKAVTKGQG